MSFAFKSAAEEAAYRTETGSMPGFTTTPRTVRSTCCGRRKSPGQFKPGKTICQPCRGRQ